MHKEIDSLDNNEDISQKTIESLLKPLGLDIYNFYEMFSIVNSHGEVIDFVEFNDDYDHWPLKEAYAMKLKDIWQYLCSYGRIIVRGSDMIENPYYGCTCLEEAMVRKDLAYGC